MDAAPGRLNATQAFITTPGEFVGHVQNCVDQVIIRCRLQSKLFLMMNIIHI